MHLVHSVELRGASLLVPCGRRERRGGDDRSQADAAVGAKRGAGRKDSTMHAWNTWAEADRVGRQVPGLDVVSPEAFQAVTDRFTDAFVSDPSWRWWWEKLGGGLAVERVEYGDRRPWSVLRGWLPVVRPVVLLVTDEDPRPWGSRSRTR
jgi:hypothetical protein